MAYQTVFKRVELKYMLSAEQRLRLLRAIEPYMKLDSYGKTTIRNLYFDTDNYLLIRRSIENKIYKEKLRLRSYARPEDTDTVFVELKKKYKQVVYKRRISLPQNEAMSQLNGRTHWDSPTQISDEIDYFLNYYKTLQPKAFIAYDREAYYSCDGTDFRVTFDDNIMFRQEELSLNSKVYGTKILPEGIGLMEIKCSAAIPLWMARVLSEEGIYKTSFSKYGAAYKKIIYPQLNSSSVTSKGDFTSC